MCLVTFDPTVHIAEEDMVVYKEGKFCDYSPSIFKSILIDFFYNKGVLYETEIKESNFQSCYDFIAINFYHNTEKFQKLYSFGKGFHSAFNIKRLEYYSIDNKLAEFIVPKGSEYIKDETGLLVSNKIIFKQWI